ncbi:hypothetical protein M3Y94_00117400 [Aphelenchoides besseyi]|nr:hypothetical protein M3Y94_00117400 [Aphelenchoides besseyi]
MIHSDNLVDEDRTKSTRHPGDRVASFLRVLLHASKCRRARCGVQCEKMRMVVKHFRACDHRCRICRTFFSTIYAHAKSCTNSHCTLLFCKSTKVRMATMLASEEENQTN